MTSLFWSKLFSPVFPAGRYRLISCPSLISVKGGLLLNESPLPSSRHFFQPEIEGQQTPCLHTGLCLILFQIFYTLASEGLLRRSLCFPLPLGILRKVSSYDLAENVCIRCCLFPSLVCLRLRRQDVSILAHAPQGRQSFFFLFPTSFTSLVFTRSLSVRELHPRLSTAALFPCFTYLAPFAPEISLQ